jgi:hypothetical protein
MDFYGIVRELIANLKRQDLLSFAVSLKCPKELIPDCGLAFREIACNIASSLARDFGMYYREDVVRVLSEALVEASHSHGRLRTKKTVDKYLKDFNDGTDTGRAILYAIGEPNPIEAFMNVVRLTGNNFLDAQMTEKDIVEWLDPHKRKLIDELDYVLRGLRN